MKDVKLTITINKPVEEVFAFATNPENTPKWLDFMVIEQTNEWPVKLGTIYKNQNKDGQWSEYEMTDFEPNKTFVLSKKNGDGYSYHVKYTFTPTDQNTTKLEYYEWVDEGEMEEPFTIDILEKLKQIVESA